MAPVHTLSTIDLVREQTHRTNTAFMFDMSDGADTYFATLDARQDNDRRLRDLNAEVKRRLEEAA